METDLQAVPAEGVIKAFEDRDRWPTLTPLIVTLIADEAVHLWRREGSLTRLSRSTAAAVLDYLRRLNLPEQIIPEEVEEEENLLINTARVLAKCCLSSAYAPGQVDRNRAILELSNASLQDDSVDILNRLVQSGVLEMKKPLGTSFLKFALDPVAEYLAAMYWIDHLQSDSKKWGAWIMELENVPGYPIAIQGFLRALEDCAVTYKAEFGLPDLVFPWNEVSPRTSAVAGDTIQATSHTM
jgi:hypothetical protein